MMFFTSDTHFSHHNIIRYCDRPFIDTDQMDEEIIRRWNETVGPDDTVFHLGDIALGPIEKSLALVSRLNGYKIAKLGNHDRPFMRAGKPDEMSWWDEYSKVFDEVWHWTNEQKILISGEEFSISHFPYTGDHTPNDRHSDHRLFDDGTSLIHGHTHTKDRLTHSVKGTPQIHVGVDAHDFKPVSEIEILRLNGLMNEFDTYGYIRPDWRKA